MEVTPWGHCQLHHPSQPPAKAHGEAGMMALLSASLASYTGDPDRASGSRLQRKKTKAPRKKMKTPIVKRSFHVTGGEVFDAVWVSGASLAWPVRVARDAAESPPALVEMRSDSLKVTALQREGAAGRTPPCPPGDTQLARGGICSCSFRFHREAQE